MSTNENSKIKSIEDLKYYLNIAMQLEHATIPPYLIGLYTIKPGSNMDAVNVIRAVVVEEMLHLTLACNLLNAIGGSPNLSAKGFVAQYPTYLPDGERDFEVNRAAFSPDTLETFLNIERPASTKTNQGNSENRKTSLINTSKDDGNPSMNFYSIGGFYDEIIRGFKDLNEKYPNKLFSGDVQRQISSEYYYSSGGNVVTVNDLASALDAINEIIEQGEGSRNSIEDPEHEIAHYYRFEQLKLGRYYRAGDKSGEPSGESLHVDWDAVFPMKQNVTQADYPEGSEMGAASIQFNAFYTTFLQNLTDAFNGKPELLIPAVGEMFHIKSLINALVRNPIPGNEQFNGGPTFEVNLIDAAKAGHDVSGDELNKHQPIASEDLYAFIDLSVSLTGFSAYQLHATNQLNVYYSTLVNIVGKRIMDELLSVYHTIKSNEKEQSEEEAIRYHLMSEPKLGPVTRNIVKLWYSGYWYQLPDEWRSRFGSNPNDIDFVVSAESYTEGLMWQAIGANPSGAKPLGYGTWAAPPTFG